MIFLDYLLWSFRVHTLTSYSQSRHERQTARTLRRARQTRGSSPSRARLPPARSTFKRKTNKLLQSINVKVDGVLNSDVRSPDSPTSRERLGCSVADVNQCEHFKFLYYLLKIKNLDCIFFFFYVIGHILHFLAHSCCGCVALCTVWHVLYVCAW